MKVELRLTDDGDAHIIKNLWPLYVHEVSEFGGGLPNRHGLILEGDTIKSLTEQGETQSAWWRRPESLFPYLILVDGRPAGFNLVATHPSIPQEIDADFEVHEFFVVHADRGKGVAVRAAREGFDRHRGRWEVVTYPTHAQAIAFWRRVLGDYTRGDYRERQGEHPWGPRVIWNFDNGP
jgi:predicted acetyltransferase